MSDSSSPICAIVMGVCGTGKTTVGLGLATRLGVPFADADDYHPATNVAKMRDGIALTDADRAPWLDRLRDEIATHRDDGRGLVLACSALREEYRERLSQGLPDLRFIFLHGDRELLQQRMASRENHYMPASLLDSQLATLEVPAPADALWCNVADTPETIITQAHAYLTTSPDPA